MRIIQPDIYQHAWGGGKKRKNKVIRLRNEQTEC